MTEPTIKVLLADDHPVVREGLRTMLRTTPDIQVVAEANDGREAIEAVTDHQPNVVLMDLRMPNLDGLEATRHIKKQLPHTAVVVLTMYDNDAFIVDAVRAGASGYLLKDASRDLLIHTIRAVNSGGILIKTSVLREAMGSFNQATQTAARGQPTSRPKGEELSAREREVLQLLVEGDTNKDIATALLISEDTAKKHVQNILAKLEASDRTQAAVKAVRAGLVR